MIWKGLDLDQDIEIDAKKRMFLLLLSATCLVANGNPPPSSPCLSEELLPEPSPKPNLKPRPDRRPRKWSQIECAVFHNCYEKVLSDKDKEDEIKITNMKVIEYFDEGTDWEESGRIYHESLKFVSFYPPSV